MSKRTDTLKTVSLTLSVDYPPSDDPLCKVSERNHSDPIHLITEGITQKGQKRKALQRKVFLQLVPSASERY